MLAEKITICEHFTSYWAKHTYDGAIHAEALFECGQESLTDIRKHFRIEGIYSWAPFPESVEKAEMDEILNRGLWGFIQGVRWNALDNNRWPFHDCLWSFLGNDADRALKGDSKCELLTYGPRFLGGITYRWDSSGTTCPQKLKTTFRIVDGDKMLLANTPLSRLDIFDHFLHFIVEILCKAVHGCKTIVWLMVPQTAKLLSPQLEALKATRHNELWKEYAEYLGRVGTQVFVCNVEDYYAPEHLRRAAIKCRLFVPTLSKRWEITLRLGKPKERTKNSLNV